MPTLAERLSIVGRSGQEELKEKDWDDVKRRCIERGDHLSSCPICQEAWGTRGQVVLNCSHLFHQVTEACLQQQRI
ncbi:hypothetical protein M427DRAFT_56956 [Gonapodya prolifera JEL478]|uniref:Uncharacterized protein n=1 Tax=Gonapodya prolifera (strain JEL478) TaxID=1344416 RepID=A0A139AE26_GONPJ|nr:hypothetical protein M427DRAFT_56956 [Gonapodya prolifera JEL478]|eukprot:KXS15051.1 hypothetical protein M427DRAFT_56956 [Gonapodya prolifera JEL478]